MKLDEQYKEKVIRHELGHWLVAQKLGFATGDIIIKIMIDTHGRYYHQCSSYMDLNPSLNNIKDICNYIFKRASVLFAGTAFQGISDLRETHTILASDGSDDNSKINEIIFLWRGIKYSNDTSYCNELEQRNILIDKCWSKAMEIYEEHAASVDIAVEVISLKIQKFHTKYVMKKVELLELLIK